MLGLEGVWEPSPKAGLPAAVRFRKFQVQIWPVQRSRLVDRRWQRAVLR